MKKTRRLLALLTALAMAASLCACGSGSSAPETKAAETEAAAAETEAAAAETEAAAAETEAAAAETEAAAPADGEVYKIIIADEDNEERTINVCAEHFKERVEEESGGRLQVEIHCNGELGGDQETVEAMTLGQIQIILMGAAGMGNYDVKFGMLDLPFLFDDYDEMSAAVTGPLGDLYNEVLNEYGFQCLGWEYDGARSMSNNVRPINSLDDCKGLKMRVMQNDVYISMFKAFGTNPTPMSATEIYTALQQGVIDGQDNPPALGFSQKYYEVQKYYSWTRHTFQNCIVLTTTKWLDSLPADLREIVETAAADMAAEQRQMEHENESAMEQAIQDSGVCETNEVADRDSFKTVVKPVYDEMREAMGSDFMDRILEAAGKTGVY